MKLAPNKNGIEKLWTLFSWPYFLFIALPLLALFLQTNPSLFFRTLMSPIAVVAIKITLFTSAISTLLAILLGMPVALLGISTKYKNRRIVEAVTDLPTVLPPSVAGVALLMAFGRNGLLGPFLSQFGISLPFTTTAVILAQLFVASPFFIKSAILGLESINKELHQAAEIEGATRWQIFLFVDTPLAWRAFVSGVAMTWARAIGEFGATILFAGNFQGRTQTMPLAIYVGFESDHDLAITLSVLLIIFAFSVLWFVRSSISHRSMDLVGHQSI